jgi:hypothetical protein
MNKAIRLAPLLLSAAQLAACGGGGGSSSTPSAPASIGSASTGSIAVAVDQSSTASSARRGPQYIPAGSYHANLWIDSTSAAAGSATCTTSLCTVAYSTTAGSHNFVLEINSGSYVIAAGHTGNVTVFPGSGNNYSLVLNGAAAGYVVSADSCLATACTQTFAIEDHSANNITGSAFDTGTVSFSVVTDSGSSPGTIVTGATETAPSGSGNAYTLQAQCNSTGSFHINAADGSPSGIAGITGGQLSAAGLSYATMTATTYEYTCVGTSISDSSGTITAS